MESQTEPKKVYENCFDCKKPSNKGFYRCWDCLQVRKIYYVKCSQCNFKDVKKPYKYCYDCNMNYKAKKNIKL